MKFIQQGELKDGSLTSQPIPTKLGVHPTTKRGIRNHILIYKNTISNFRPSRSPP
jgi:hypothetical protein